MTAKITTREAALLDGVARHLRELRNEHAAAVRDLRRDLEALRAEYGAQRRLDELVARLDRLEASPRSAGSSASLRTV